LPMYASSGLSSAHHVHRLAQDAFHDPLSNPPSNSSYTCILLPNFSPTMAIEVSPDRSSSSSEAERLERSLLDASATAADYIGRRPSTSGRDTKRTSGSPLRSNDCSL
jgi:hypothetical protein